MNLYGMCGWMSLLYINKTNSLLKICRLLDLVVRPVGLCSSPFGSNLQVSPRASCMLSSPLNSNPRCSVLLHKNLTSAPELKLLETPAVVKVYRMVKVGRIY